MRYSQRSLERLIIAIYQLEDERELKIAVQLGEVLRPRVVAQVPASLHYRPAPDYRELPSEPTPAIINAMERTFYGDAAIDSITGPDDPEAHSQWKIWSEVYRAMLEAASGPV